MSSALGHLSWASDYATVREQKEAERIASDLSPAQLKEHFRQLRAEMYERRAKRQEGSES